MRSRGPRIDPCDTIPDTNMGWENIFLNLTKNALFMR